MANYLCENWLFGSHDLLLTEMGESGSLNKEEKKQMCLTV